LRINDSTKKFAGNLKFLLLVSLILFGAVAVYSTGAGSPNGKVCVVRYSGPIHPIAAEIIQGAAARAEKEKAQLLVIELDTPGGLMNSMQDIKKAILNSPVPVAVFVSPKGAQAASAGFFIVLAADLAVMAPGSSMGAAHPINLQGGEMSEALEKKILHSAVSELKSMAEVRGRNPELAIEAVQGEIKSFTAEEALEHNLIDFIANNLDDLIAQSNGREITRFGGEKIILELNNVQIVEIPLTLRERVLSAIADPNILFLLLGLGVLGLYVEITHPGLILPGIIGGIFIILALFSMQALPINYAGVLLILLAFIFFLAEIKVVSYGFLTVGGIISLILGGMLLMKETIPGLEVNLATLITVAMGIGIISAIIVYLIIRAHRGGIHSGAEAMIGEEGAADTAIHKDGRVFIHGEYWNAFSDDTIDAGALIVVVGQQGMKLKVKTLEKT